jgi:F420-dependent oxidoreductase-like protein
MRIGIFGGDPGAKTLDDLVASAREVEERGFASFAVSQTFGGDSITVLALVGREVPRIELATGVVPIYLRHPHVMAQQALTAQVATQGRFLLGIGLSHQIVIEGMFGLSFDAPLRAMREYLSVLVPLLHEGQVSFEGETVTARATVTVREATAPPVLIAALGPKMLDLAGRVADGTMTWMTGLGTLRAHVVPVITAAASAAARPAPRIAASLPVCVTDDVPAARAFAARAFQIYGTLPSYRAMLDREGAEGPADVVVVGGATEVAGVIRAMEDAGVTDFVASPFGSRDDRRRTLDALQALL